MNNLLRNIWLARLSPTINIITTLTFQRQPLTSASRMILKASVCTTWSKLKKSVGTLWGEAALRLLQGWVYQMSYFCWYVRRHYVWFYVSHCSCFPLRHPVVRRLLSHCKSLLQRLTKSCLKADLPGLAAGPFWFWCASIGSNYSHFFNGHWAAHLNPMNSYMFRSLKIQIFLWDGPILVCAAPSGDGWAGSYNVCIQFPRRST